MAAIGNQNAKGNRGGRGGPSRFKPQFVAQAKKACEAGFTDKELGELFGVNESTVNAWKADHPEFGQALKGGKAVADDRVEQSLYNRANGYSHPEVHVSNYQGEVTLTPLTKHYPPETTACIFWLKNRRPEVWRDRVEHTGAGGKDLIPATDAFEIAREMAFLLELGSRQSQPAVH